jgi:hypothetical protein
MERSSMIDKLITAIALTIALGLFASLEHISSFKTLAYPILTADLEGLSLYLQNR